MLLPSSTSTLMVIDEYELTGVDHIENNLDMLLRNVRDKQLKRAMKKTIDPIQAAAKARVDRDTGTLADAIQQKISSAGGKGEFVMGIVGIRRGIKFPIRVVTRGKHKGKVYVLIPTRYAHLLEFGHKLVVHAIWERDPTSKHGRLRRIHKSDGLIVGSASPRPFMRPAWDQHGGTVALQVFLTELDKGLQEEVSKLPKN